MLRAYIAGFADPIHVDRIGIDTNSYFSLLALADIRDNVGAPDEVIPESFGFLVEGVRMRVSADYFKRAYDESVSDISKEARDEDGARCTGKYGFSPDALQKLGFTEQGHIAEARIFVAARATTPSSSHRSSTTCGQSMRT